MTDTTGSLTIRPIDEADSIDELTALLHRAYRHLADMGLQFVATHQSSEVTRERIAKGTCLVARAGGGLVGTITYRPPHILGGSPWLDRLDVAHISQLGVEPAVQGKGVGRKLMDAAEELAVRDGAAELALDTAETAHHLIRWYERLGYRYIEPVDWRPHTNYRSVVMSKLLVRDAGL